MLTLTIAILKSALLAALSEAVRQGVRYALKSLAKS